MKRLFVFLMVVVGLAITVWIALTRVDDDPATKTATPVAPAPRPAPAPGAGPPATGDTLGDSVRQGMNKYKPQATTPPTSTPGGGSGEWKWSDLLPSLPADECSVRNKTVVLNSGWQDLHQGGCLVVYQLDGRGLGQDGFGTFPLDPSLDPCAVGRNPDRVRGTGRIKYSLCDASLEGSALNMRCDRVPACTRRNAQGR